MFFKSSDDPKGEPRSAKKKMVPLLPLRDIILVPHMETQLFVGREQLHLPDFAQVQFNRRIRIVTATFLGRSVCFLVARHHSGRRAHLRHRDIALASNPSIVLADEPTGNLDRATGSMVADMLFAIARERSATLVVVTHDPAVPSRAQRLLRMRDGRIVPGESP